MKSDQIRKAYTDYFSGQKHRVVPSSPLVPPDDPTLLFTTAGMVQFKPLYAGYGELPYTRACSVQKCMRAGGKGSDLENVGRTLRHHTFFEMLGNFSFGDYFKREALQFAWEFSTKVVKLDPARIYASVYEDDDEAWDIWTRELGMPESHMVRLGAKDNFWGPAGDTGACGPCSELYFDRGEQYGPGLTFQHATTADDDPGSRFLEFWNCVFPQFDQQKDGSRPPLKNRGVDTGMGLERLCCIVQDKESPYHTDLFLPIVQAAAKELNLGDYLDLSLENQQIVNVVADHTRALTFVLSEGILPGNEGRGYVMRRLLRRAARFARKIGRETPFVYNVVPAVVDVMRDAYPEIAKSSERIRDIIRDEEEGYAHTLGVGLSKLESLLDSGSSKPVKLDGEDVFQLTATYGLPLDDIIEIAGDRGVNLDLESYQSHVEKHKSESRKSGRAGKLDDIGEPVTALFRKHGKTRFLGYYEDLIEDLPIWDDFFQKMGNFLPDGEGEDDFDDQTEEAGNIVDLPIASNGNGHQDPGLDDRTDSDDSELMNNLNVEYPLREAEDLEILGLFHNGQPVSSVRAGQQVAVVLNATPFYAESGGQVSDTGRLETPTGQIEVYDVQKTPEGVFVHLGDVENGEIQSTQPVSARIDEARRLDIMRHHTATHLLQGALKCVVGDLVTQQGSYVGPDYLRFDFTCPRALSEQELREIYFMVNEAILGNIQVETDVLPLEQARQIPGIIAPFGEKYGQEVRVIRIGEFDVEFCGGTHVLETSHIGGFRIVSESSVSSGVRRIEAIAGRVLQDWVLKNQDIVGGLSRSLKVSEEKLEERVAALQEEVRHLQKQLASQKASAGAAEAAGVLEKAPEIGGVKVVVHREDDVEPKALREMYDVMKSRRPQGLFVLLAGVKDDRVGLIAGATKETAARVPAGDIARLAASMIGGNGGGKPEMAQAGGKDASRLNEALESCRKAIEEKLR